MWCFPTSKKTNRCTHVLLVVSLKNIKNKIENQPSIHLLKKIKKTPLSSPSRTPPSTICTPIPLSDPLLPDTLTSHLVLNITEQDGGWTSSPPGRSTTGWPRFFSRGRIDDEVSALLLSSCRLPPPRPPPPWALGISAKSPPIPRHGRPPPPASFARGRSVARALSQIRHSRPRVGFPAPAATLFLAVVPPAPRVLLACRSWISTQILSPPPHGVSSVSAPTVAVPQFLRPSAELLREIKISRLFLHRAPIALAATPLRITRSSSLLVPNLRRTIPINRSLSIPPCFSPWRKI